MTEPTTEAGKRASSRGWLWMPVDEARWLDADILAIEAEARLQVPTEILHFETETSPERVDEVRVYFAKIEERAIAAERARLAEKLTQLAADWPASDDLPAVFLGDVLALLESRPMSETTREMLIAPSAQWSSSEPVLTHCRHGLDLRTHPRCYLCNPAMEPSDRDVLALPRCDFDCDACRARENDD